MGRCLAAAALALLCASLGRAADWTPRAWAEEDTLDLRTEVPAEGAYWFPVWLVVVDDQLFVRLGRRAAERVEQSTTAPVVGVRVAGREFARVRGEPAPEMTARVAEAMAAKYTSDLLIRWFPHPLTLRLAPAP
jgi:hypothetical protein